jgi:hypothetical protein
MPGRDLGHDRELVRPRPPATGGEPSLELGRQHIAHRKAL